MVICNMTEATSADNILRLINDLITICKSCDPHFEHSSRSYGESVSRLTLDGVPESVVQRIADVFDRAVVRPIDFQIGQGAPTTHASVFVQIGSLTIFLWSNRRRATRSEIDAAIADISRFTATVDAASQATSAAQQPQLTPLQGRQ